MNGNSGSTFNDKWKIEARSLFYTLKQFTPTAP